MRDVQPTKHQPRGVAEGSLYDGTRGNVGGHEATTANYPILYRKAGQKLQYARERVRQLRGGLASWSTPASANLEEANIQYRRSRKGVADQAMRYALANECTYEAAMTQLNIDVPEPLCV